ncbi:PilX N-terminal domain-containing pilus assembly protein [Variovorax sp. H27-G14]|uniref:pilus assembly PilX family protein n=1 Tax=Variovorax sp. H27-G14 TaxID=3111914 RepID=UPI0038FBF424
MKQTLPFRAARQRGVSLIIVLLLLVIVSILGVGAAQIATMGERSARNDRDMQVAWQSAEAALMDAEFDIHGPGTTDRKAVFTDMANTNAFVSGCGDSGNSKGLCTLVTTGQPAWLAVDFNATTNAKTAAFGDFTGRAFPAGDTGIQPFKAPRYVIEPIEDPSNRDISGSTTKYIYRVTAMGFGPRADIQGVVQILYRD